MSSCGSLWLAISLICLLLSPAQAFAQLRLLAEIGPELDSNATRLQQAGSGAPDPVMAGLLRLIGRGELGLRVGARHYLSLAYGGGGKVFWSEEARSADELVQHGDLGWAVRLPPGALAVQGSYYDAYQRDSLRDFRTASAGLRFMLGRPPSSFAAAFTGAYRWLQYKPAERYSFHALQLGTDLSYRPTAEREADAVDWALGLQYMGSLRFYEGAVVSSPLGCAGGLDDPPCELDVSRRDLNHYLRAQANYLGAGDLALWYASELNWSNSLGESFIRHAVGLKFTAALSWGIFLSAKGTIQLSRFSDPYPPSEISSLSLINIDDENRSSLIVQFARDLDERWALHLRYSLYVNESSGQADRLPALDAPSFVRHTVFFGARFEYEKRP